MVINIYQYGSPLNGVLKNGINRQEVTSQPPGRHLIFFAERGFPRKRSMRTETSAKDNINLREVLRYQSRMNRLREIG